VWWHELGEMENECISHNFSQFAIFLPKISKLVEIWRNFDKNNFAQFFWDTVYIFNFWHSGTLALRAERQSVRISEIENAG